MRMAMDSGAFDPVRILPKLGGIVDMMGCRRDGSEFPIEFSASYWKAEGEVNFTAIVRDVTERKRLEQRVPEMAQTDPSDRALASARGRGRPPTDRAVFWLRLAAA